MKTSEIMAANQDHLESLKKDFMNDGWFLVEDNGWRICLMTYDHDTVIIWTYRNRVKR